tara:strand:+ start:65 stop:400 length:336 start_codon:yes stop_codon:yes gene_type:complete
VVVAAVTMLEVVVEQGVFVVVKFQFVEQHHIQLQLVQEVLVQEIVHQEMVHQEVIQYLDVQQLQVVAVVLVILVVLLVYQEDQVAVPEVIQVVHLELVVVELHVKEMMVDL